MAAQATQTILTVNSGSSSLKFRLYEMGAGEVLLSKGAAEGIDQGPGRLWLQDADGSMVLDEPLADVGHAAAVDRTMAALASGDLPSIEAIGHRVVHGGPNQSAPVRVTDELLADLDGHIAWAPNHMPAALRAIRALRAADPVMPQVACFDTAFHAVMPEVARRLPLPRPLFDQGVRKYGFHGLSYESVFAELGPRAAGRTVAAHLGNGASMVACLDGRPVDTTMGMSPLGGFMMGTRSGDLDPGVVVYLGSRHVYAMDEVESLLAERSGLLGVSGETADMEQLLALCDAGHAAANQAVDMFCYQARRAVGSLAAALGGLDHLVFTAGIGENAPAVRANICRGLAHLGVVLDDDRNAVSADVISAAGSRCDVLVVHTREDLMIARHTHALVFGADGAVPAAPAPTPDEGGAA